MSSWSPRSHWFTFPQSYQKIPPSLLFLPIFCLCPEHYHPLPSLSNPILRSMPWLQSLHHLRAHPLPPYCASISPELCPSQSLSHYLPKPRVPPGRGCSSPLCAPASAHMMFTGDICELREQTSRFQHIRGIEKCIWTEWVKLRRDWERTKQRTRRWRTSES